MTDEEFWAKFDGVNAKVKAAEAEKDAATLERSNLLGEMAEALRAAGRVWIDHGGYRFKIRSRGKTNYLLNVGLVPK